MTPWSLTRSHKLHHKSEITLPRLGKKKPFKKILCSIKPALIKMNQFHKYVNIFIPQMLSGTFRTGECIAEDISYV